MLKAPLELASGTGEICVFPKGQGRRGRICFPFGYLSFVHYYSENTQLVEFFKSKVSNNKPQRRSYLRGTKSRWAWRAWNSLPPQGPVLGDFMTGDRAGWETGEGVFVAF